MARTGLARALSKLGFCSRSQAAVMIQSGKVSLNGRVCRDPEKPVLLEQDKIVVEGQSVKAPEHRYLMLNKPRGLVTTASDEQGRDTVFSCFEGASLPHLGPVGRLDKASEGLLLFTNDTVWANQITDPATHLPKTYHVQVSGLVDEALLARLKAGVVDQGERLELRAIQILRQGEKNTWLEITLDEGKNRHIRRVMEVHGLEVLRLFRVSIGSLELGNLAKGSWRHLTPTEIQALGSSGDSKR
ncbi:pseudouridine synthase [Brevifollis gellanilyticus]|uniref:Pseudouridine synthase n=1 Tax=Brevifollis gellanilyticus TaxID=748831 RepID=A0A512MES7_9BACT|nr:pseudouridine synthase [Brevifollis gellanilyticus]GEP45208.1 pseudouridine synthase [Brevifollis gellanilyticus]